MSTKYKYGENGSYFDPETKRTYYKDPQYQKAYDDEWNRLEKFYKMKQEEQRKIEMANFQRVLAQADALTKSMQALGYRTPLPWEQKNRFDGTENSEIERAPEDKIYITENSLTGKDEYIRGNSHPVSFDKETGELVDAITDERTSFDTELPQEVVITGRKRYNPVYMSSPSALIPLPGILNPSVEEYVKAADNTASAFSAANWMDTAYDAMYTPDEINYPWDEGNEGLGDPVLDLLFDAGAYGLWAKAIGAGAKGVSMANNYAKGAAQRYRWANRPNINAHSYFKKIKFADPEDLKGKDLDLKNYFQINEGYDEKTKQRTNNIWDFDLQKPDGTWIGGVYGRAEKGNPSIEFNLMSESPQINRRFGYKFTADIPDWSVLASDTEAKTASYIPKEDKWKYIFTGKVPEEPITKYDYSLDVAKMLKSMYEHPKPGFEVEISPYFKMNSTNPYSQNFDKFAKEFNVNPDAGKIPFDDFTPQQIDHFNFKYGDTYGVIDPETRTMPYYVVRKVPTKVSKKKKNK